MNRGLGDNCFIARSIIFGTCADPPSPIPHYADGNSHYADFPLRGIPQTEILITQNYAEVRRT